MLQYQMAATSKQNGATTVKNNHVYYNKNGVTIITELKSEYVMAGRYAGGSVNGNWNLCGYYYSDNEDYIDGSKTLVELAVNDEKSFYTEFPMDSTPVTSTITNATLINYFENKIFNNTSRYTASGTKNKAKSECYSVASSSSSTQKTYITDETASITQLNLQGNMFPQIIAQYDSTTAKEYALSSSLSSNGLTSTSTIPHKGIKQGTVSYTRTYVRGDSYQNSGDYVGTSGQKTSHIVKKIYSVNDAILSTTPTNMVTDTTAASYADGNGSTLSNGVYYNTPSGYAKNNLYVAKGEAANETGEVDGNFQVRPEFVCFPFF